MKELVRVYMYYGILFDCGFLLACYAAAVLFRMSEDKPADYRQRLSANLHHLYHNEVSTQPSVWVCYHGDIRL